MLAGSSKLGIILMALWLILTGLTRFAGIAFTVGDVVLSILALIAGVTILVDWLRLRSVLQPTRALGMSILGTWLILSSLLPVVAQLDPGVVDQIWALMAIAAGVLLLLG